MSVIKEIYEVAKDAAALRANAVALKRALLVELKLNRKCLNEVEKSLSIDDDRRREIIDMLDLEELSAAVKYNIPYITISRKKVTKELATTFKVKRIEGADLQKVIESLYLLISYLKKENKSKRNNIDLNLRLINIYKYNRVLMELLK
jgi:hypothetical protein